MYGVTEGVHPLRRKWRRGLPLLLIAGKSGSGKDTLARKICADLGLTQVASYTTRPIRPGEVNGVGHIFLTDEEYDRIPKEDIVASTYFSGYRYCATRQQLDQAGVYVVDKQGIEDVLRNYDGAVLVILLDTTDSTRRERMRKRGDSSANIEKRISGDRKAFAGIEQVCDIIFNADDISVDVLAREIETVLMRAAQYTEG